MKFAEYVAIAGELVGNAGLPSPGETVIMCVCAVESFQRP